MKILMKNYPIGSRVKWREIPELHGLVEEPIKKQGNKRNSPFYLGVRTHKNSRGKGDLILSKPKRLEKY